MCSEVMLIKRLSISGDKCDYWVAESLQTLPARGARHIRSRSRTKILRFMTELLDFHELMQSSQALYELPEPLQVPLRKARIYTRDAVLDLVNNLLL
jgi:hypothetical protein